MELNAFFQQKAMPDNVSLFFIEYIKPYKKARYQSTVNTLIKNNFTQKIALNI